MAEPVLRTPDAPATPKQTFYIYKLGGGDVRGENLTMQQAADRIKVLLEKSGKPDTTKSDAKPVTEPVTDQAETAKRKFVSFGKLMDDATKAANEAGAAWLTQATPQYRVLQHANPMDDNSPVVKDYGTMLDVCAIVYIQITDKRTAFAKWAIAHGGAPNGHFLRVPHNYVMRQEMGLLEAAYGAALKVLQDAGIPKLSLYSRID